MKRFLLQSPIWLSCLGLLAGCGLVRGSRAQDPLASIGPSGTAPATRLPAASAASPHSITPQPVATRSLPEGESTLPALNTQVVYDPALNLSGTLCRPAGPGPFAAVIYNHGGLGTTIGGAPEETCAALAEANLVGFAPIRRQTVPLDGHLDDVLAAVDLVKGLDYVDPGRLGIIGFSRGGLLTFIAASQRTDFQAVVIMASALSKGQDFEQLATRHSAPILLQVASNDLPAQLNNQENVVEGMQSMHQTLEAAGKDAKLIIYPPFEPHGHMMFFEIGAYWNDALHFLLANLEPSPLPLTPTP